MPDKKKDDLSNFDDYLQDQLRDPVFREQFEAAGRALDVALQLADLRRRKGLTQEQVANKLGLRQQNVSRLENPAYRRHSLTLLRRYANALDADVVVSLVPRNPRHAATAQPNLP